jgi:rubredoxin
MNTAVIDKKYMCLICGWIYDEADGVPEDGIEPGTPWEKVPPNWVCPECGARKEDFEMVEI